MTRDDGVPLFPVSWTVDWEIRRDGHALREFHGRRMRKHQYPIETEGATLMPETGTLSVTRVVGLDDGDNSDSNFQHDDSNCCKYAENCCHSGEVLIHPPVNQVLTPFLQMLSLKRGYTQITQRI